MRWLEQSFQVTGKGFLHVDSNKVELYKFLPDVLPGSFSQEDKQLVIIDNESTVSKLLLQNSASLSPCSHEEADSRMLPHANHVVHTGSRPPKEPNWTTLPEASKELISCKYMKGCKGHSKCRKDAHKCTTLCTCEGECTQHRHS